MIKYGYNDKNLVVPSGLGFGGAKSGGGSGGGVTPEEVAEIASGITEEAIDEYDTELQVDLEEIREAVSGNTEAIGNLSDSLSAYTTDSELQQALQEYATTAQTQAISDSLANYATTAQTQAIAGDVAELSGATQAIEQSLADYATTADTASLSEAISGVSDALAGYATTATTEAITGQVSVLSGDVQTLSASTSANTANIAALSASTGALEQDVEGKQDKPFVLELSTLDEAGLTNEDKANIDALFAYLDGKTIDEVNAVLANPDDGETLYKLTYTNQNLAKFNTLWGWGGEEVHVGKEVDEGTGDDVYYISTDDWYVTEYVGGNGIEVEDGEIRVKVGKGLYFKEDGKMEVSPGRGIGFSGDSLTVKVGDGLGFSGDTLVVSGGTGGGIEKVSELPQDAEDGDMVWLEGGTFEGITILCAQSSAGYVFELDSNYYNIDGNEPTRRLGNFPMARWFAEPDNSDIKMRLRFTDDDYTILDVIDTSGTHSISGGTSAVETYEDVEFQMRDVLYVYQNGKWFRKNRIEWVYDADEAEDLIYDIYHSDKEFPLDDLVIRLDPEKRGDKREFVPYSTAYFGMDMQCTDSRGNHDWGQIKVYCYRFNFDGTLSDLVGEQMIKVESQLQHVDFFRVVVDSGGTVDADSRSQMEAFYGMHSVLNTVEFEWNGSNNAFGAAPVKYWYRQTENVGGEDKLVYYVCAEVPINGTLYRGLWVWPEWSMPDPFTPTSWTAV